MKMVKRLVSLAVALVMVMSLVACGCEKGIVGTWSSESEFLGQKITSSYTFNEDGTYESAIIGIKQTGTYTIEGDKMTIKFNSSVGVMTETYTFAVDGDELKLTMQNGNTAVYERQ